jgi:hypothetical protein
MWLISLSKQQVVQCLSVHGHWASFDPELQLDPAEFKALRKKNATLSTVFEAAWLLAPLQQGKLLHILAEVLDLVAREQLVIPMRPAFEMSRIGDAFDQMTQKHFGAVVVVP